MTKIKTTSNRRRKRSSKPTKWSSIKDMLLTMGYSSLPYRFLISRRVPIEISGSPGDLRSGDATLGNKILAGNFSFVGQTLNVQIEDSVSGLPWNNYSFGEKIKRDEKRRKK